MNAFNFKLPSKYDTATIPVYFKGMHVGESTTENGICYCVFDDTDLGRIAKEIVMGTKQISLEINIEEKKI